MSELSRDLRVVEAMLFASAEPVSEAQFAQRLPDDADVTALVAELSAHYEGRGVHVVKVGKAWALRTAPDLAEALRIETSTTRRLSRAAIETLSIIAYHQPVTRAEIEEIRGVSHSKGTLDVLLEAGWIKPGRRRMTPGRPVTWMTTPEFLDHFGLESIKDLPGVDELKSAGLLDARPAIQAFRGIVDPDAEMEDGEDADGEDIDGEDRDDDEEIDLDESPAGIADAPANDPRADDEVADDEVSDAGDDIGADAAAGGDDAVDERPEDDDRIVRQAR
jgi:segregation and condensation protein B